MSLFALALSLCGAAEPAPRRLDLDLAYAEASSAVPASFLGPELRFRPIPRVRLAAGYRLPLFSRRAPDGARPGARLTYELGIAF